MTTPEILTALKAQRETLEQCRIVIDKLCEDAKRTPTAFRWTPEMSAIWPKDYRPTMTGLLAMWEAMHEAAEYSELGSKAASDDGWIEWNGGVMPVFPGTQIAVRHRGGEEHTDTAGGWYSNSWGHDDVEGDIIAYRVIK